MTCFSVSFARSLAPNLIREGKVTSMLYYTYCKNQVRCRLMTTGNAIQENPNAVKLKTITQWLKSNLTLGTKKLHIYT